MKKYKISFVINSIIVFLVLIATFLMATKTEFMGNSGVLSSPGFGTFKFFTVDSNILMGIASLIFLYYERLFLRKKIKEIPKYSYLLKHIATVGVALTFVTTTFYLAPFSNVGFFNFYKNSNLFFHLIIPILSIITYLFYERYNIFNYKIAFYGMISMIIYAVYYIGTYFEYYNDGIDYYKNGINYQYDWYGFIGNGGLRAIVSISLMFIITFVISFGLWYLNKKIRYDK